MPSNIPTTARADLVARCRELGRALANETMSDSDTRALERARATVQAQIDAIDAAEDATTETPEQEAARGTR